MAKSDANLRQISVNGESVTVTLGAAHATVPGGQIDSFIRALEAARLMLALEIGPAAETQAPRVEASPKGYTTYEPREEAAPVKRRVGRPKGSGKAPIRRSRKRVGDALADWLRDNPGGHSTDDLLSIVSDNRMTDASPKRALMIALGKQRDSVFVSDGEGNWKLAGDPSPTQAAAPKERKKPGRKPGSGANTKARGKAAGKTGRAKGGRGRSRAPKGDADAEGSPVSEPVLATGRLVRVKKGQDRREALLTPTELEARKQAATAVDTMHFRWDVASRAERERMRRNLFGDGVGKAN